MNEIHNYKGAGIKNHYLLLCKSPSCLVSHFKLRIMKFPLVMLTAKLLADIAPCICDFEDSELLNLPACFEWGTNLTYGFKF